MCNPVSGVKVKVFVVEVVEVSGVQAIQVKKKVQGTGGSELVKRLYSSMVYA